MALLSAVKEMTRYCLSELGRRHDQYRRRLQRQRVSIILARKDLPDCSAAEAVFENLQNEYSGVPEYGYDPYSTWSRGLERIKTLLKMVDCLKTPGMKVLEAGCGDAMTGYLLSAFGHEVMLTDMDDWRDKRAHRLPFSPSNICLGLPFEDQQFDVCVTYNSFEHFIDPEAALTQLIRVLKPGGWLFTDFGPLYAGPWGLHAYRTLRMPYPQFLFSETFWHSKLHTIGMHDLNRSMDDLQPMNRFTVTQFRELWKSSGCEIVKYVDQPAEPHLDIIERFPESFQGRGLTIEDVSTQSMKVLLRKVYAPKFKA